VDLVQGGTRTYDPSTQSVDLFAPAAWLPDGSGLIVLETTYADDPTTQGIARRLSILDLSTGSFDSFAEATWPIATPGFAVAVSPDGARIAYQYSNFVTVLDRATGEKTRIDLASYFVLAGRSAWAPDGSLTLVHRDWQAPGRRWELVLVDPETGEHRSTIASLRDQALMRLVGWSGTDPVVVSYDGGDCPVMHGGPGDVLGYREATCLVGIHLLLQGGGERVLVQPTAGVHHIDAAQTVLANPITRPGDPPWTVPAWGTPVALVALLAAAVLVVWAVRRRRALSR
jgi:hypothetical protein